MIYICIDLVILYIFRSKSLFLNIASHVMYFNDNN